MKYVVTVVDPDTGKTYMGNIPTTKSHARRWANQYVRDGFRAAIAPVDGNLNLIADGIRAAFEAEKNHRWDLVKVRFAWRNMEDRVVKVYLYVRELYMDWYGECENCPENDAVIFDIQIGTTVIPNEVAGDIQFQDLMALIEETWPPHKNGPRRPGTDPASKKQTDHKRGRPSKISPYGLKA